MSYPDLEGSGLMNAGVSLRRNAQNLGLRL